MVEMAERPFSKVSQCQVLGLANNQTPQALSVHLHITVLQSTQIYLLSQMWTNGKYDSEVGPLTKCKSIGPG